VFNNKKNNNQNDSPFEILLPFNNVPIKPSLIIPKQRLPLDCFSRKNFLISPKRYTIKQNQLFDPDTVARLIFLFLLNKKYGNILLDSFSI